MSETNIKITLAVADAAAQKALNNFVSQADKSDKALNKLKESGSEAFNEIGVHIGKATGLYDVFAGSLAANLVIKSFELLQEGAHALFETFVVDGVRAAIAQQDAINALNVALANSGKYSKETSDDFVEFAEKLQNSTKFSNDAIIQNAALIQSLGHLSEDGLKRATQASLDLAAGLGKDLPEASQLVAKAAAGNVTALSKLGIEIQKGRTDAETFANALAALEARFGGSAAAQVNTYSGAIAQAGNSFEDLTKVIGDMIIKNPAAIETIATSNKIFQELTTSLSANGKAYLELVASGLATFLETMGFVVATADVAVRVFQTLYGVVQVLSAPFLALTVPIRALQVGMKQALEEMTQFGKSTLDNLSALGKSGDGFLADLTTRLLQLRNAADDGLDRLSAGATGAVAPLKNATDNVVKLTEAQKKAREQEKAWAEEILKQADSSKTNTELQVNSARLLADQQLLVQQQLLDKKLISEETYQQNKADIEAKFDDARQNALQQQLEADQERALNDLNSGIIGKTQFYKIQNQLAAKFTADQIKLSAEEAKKDIENEKAKEEASRRTAQARMNTLTQLTELTHSKNKELFEIGKAASIAKIAIDTATGAIAAYQSLAGIPYVGPALGAAAAGALIAYGTEQAAEVASTQFQYERGGIVPGASFTGDNIVAGVNSGEMILNRQQQAELFNVANGRSGNGNSESLLQSIDRKLGALLDKDTTVIVGGKTITDTLRGELRAGRSFA